MRCGGGRCLRGALVVPTNNDQRESISHSLVSQGGSYGNDGACWQVKAVISGGFRLKTLHKSATFTPQLDHLCEMSVVPL